MVVSAVPPQPWDVKMFSGLETTFMLGQEDIELLNQRASRQRETVAYPKGQNVREEDLLFQRQDRVLEYEGA